VGLIWYACSASYLAGTGLLSQSTAGTRIGVRFLSLELHVTMSYNVDSHTLSLDKMLGLDIGGMCYIVFFLGHPLSSPLS